MKTVCAILLILLASVAALAQPTPETILDAHALVARSNADSNQRIALGNRLIAHLQKAQTWESIDAGHPDAVTLRAQIAQEETDYLKRTAESAKLDDQLSVDVMMRECTPEERNEWIQLVKELLPILHEVKTQLQRYHALGY